MSAGISLERTWAVGEGTTAQSLAVSFPCPSEQVSPQVIVVSAGKEVAERDIPWPSSRIFRSSSYRQRWKGLVASVEGH